MPNLNRVALVIGNSEYNPGYLANPVRDAALITSRLQKLGYEIVGGASSHEHPTGFDKGQNCDWKRTLDLISTFINKIERGCTAVVYYAGHALQVGAKNYLMSLDAKLGSDAPLMGLVDIKQHILQAADQAGPTGAIVVFLDACRNNPFSDDEMRDIATSIRSTSVAPTGKGAEAIARDGLSSMKFARNTNCARTFIGFATAPGDVAYDGKELNSPFARALDRHMAVRGLQLEELYDRVNQDVLDEVEHELGHYQDPWSETNLNRVLLLHPRSVWPLVWLALGGFVAGAVICWFVFEERGLANPADKPWVWGLGLIFGLVAASGAALWGSGRPRDVFLAFVGPGFGLALALAILRIVFEVTDRTPALKALTVTAVSQGVSAAPFASNLVQSVFQGITIAGGILYLLATALVWYEEPPEWPRTFMQWLNRILTWLLPLLVVGALLQLEHYMVRTNPWLTSIAMFTVLGGVIYAMSVALSCRGQQGLFGQFGPITGAITVGLLMAALFAVYASLSTTREMTQAQALPLLVFLGALWHMLLGAQLGYCYVYYVPDHRMSRR